MLSLAYAELADEADGSISGAGMGSHHGPAQIRQHFGEVGVEA